VTSPTVLQMIRLVKQGGAQERLERVVCGPISIMIYALRCLFL